MATARAPVSTLVVTALLVALGYFVGAQVGLALRFPPATTSVVWPPNAILTAALLLTPASRWWVCLGGALPVHFLIQRTVDWSLPFVGGLFVTNCSEALIAAGFIRAFSDAPLRFDTLRRVTVFIVGAGLLGPLLSSFGDAAVVRHFQAEPYWTVWRTRLFANSLTALSLVPLIVLIATGGREYLREAARRKLEAALLGGALVVVAVLTFGGGTDELDLPGVPSTPTVFVLPLFFWAALRFGAGGTSAALLIAALSASLGARGGNPAFAVLADPAESLLALQLYLIVMAVPLLAVSALLAERRSAAAELSQRLRFEALLSELSRAFVRSPAERMAQTLGASLPSVGEFFGADRIVIKRLAPFGRQLRLAQQWAARGVERLPSAHSCDAFPWMVDRLLAGHDVICGSIDDLPPGAEQDRASLAALGLRAVLVIPLVASGGVQGVLSVHMLRAARPWPAAVVEQARMVAEVLANALSRARADEALRSSESMKTAILSSLSSLVAVLDKDGRIIAVNEQWREMARGASAAFAGTGVGVSYLDVCRRAAARGETNAAEALAGVERVLGGRGGSFSVEYPASDQQGRWYTMSVTRLQRPEGGAVVAHVDVSERKRAELEAQRARQELAHFTRVSTMGELTASLAHQLNQPLTGILSNAQAARRMLDNGGVDLGALREIVVDIIADGRRAGEVIRRLRDMMTKGGREAVVTDANALIRDVVMLMTSDAIIRNVPLQLELASDAPHVYGNPIELQQVMLNLLANAIDAVADRPVAQRRVVVRSERADGGVLVSVQDSGPGLRPGSEASIFEPFFTTKATGMGMGLAIARSIVESHQGSIWAANNGGPGATFFVRLPLAHTSAS